MLNSRLYLNKITMKTLKKLKINQTEENCLSRTSLNKLYGGSGGYCCACICVGDQDADGLRDDDWESSKKD